jgi:hypothetical protein
MDAEKELHDLEVNGLSLTQRLAEIEEELADAERTLARTQAAVEQLLLLRESGVDADRVTRQLAEALRRRTLKLEIRDRILRRRSPLIVQLQQYHERMARLREQWGDESLTDSI